MIGKKSKAVEEFWQHCRREHGITTNEYHACTFADPRYATYHDELLDLVEAGKKRATAHMQLDFEKNNVKRRQVGDYWVVVTTSGNEPRYLVRVTDVTVTPFNKVELSFAAREGEGDETLKYWQDVHREYFELQCKDWGIPFPDNAPTVCEGFDMIETAKR
ncbi:MAG: ASCH domain-containing protein [Dongiaceae bacterium]